jgi:hypothetical protein
LNVVRVSWLSAQKDGTVKRSPRSVALVGVPLALLTGLLLLPFRSALPRGGDGTSAKPTSADVRSDEPRAENVVASDAPGIGDTGPNVKNTDLAPDGSPAESASAGQGGKKDGEKKQGAKKGAPDEKRKDGDKKGRRGRGICPEVSQLATHGVHGKALEQAVHALQAAHGIGKTSTKAPEKDKNKEKRSEEYMKKSKDRKDKSKDERRSDESPEVN